MKFKKSLGVLLAMTMIFSTVSCGNQSANLPNQAVTDIAGAPDYSQSGKRLDMFAYVAPTDGKLTLADGSVVQNADFRTEERYREYKECGFDTLLLLGNDPYTGIGNFESSSLKRNLDLCEKVGLKCIVFDSRIQKLSESTVPIIGSGRAYETEAALIEQLREWMAPYLGHPAFYGMEFSDEPSYAKFEAIGQLFKALRAIDPDMYINTVLLPYFSGLDSMYTGDVTLSGKKAYRDYIDSYFEATGASYIDYDSYPFKFRQASASYHDPSDSYIETTYFSNLQIMAEKAAEHGGEFYLTMQSYASIAGATNSAYKREMTLEDFRWQLNAAFAFGAKNLRYFTYWMFPSRIGDPAVSAIMSDTGEKQYYDYVQKTNAEAQLTASVVLNFNYGRTLLRYDESDYPAHFNGIKEAESIEGIEFSSTCATILNEMTDENGQLGYYVFNAEDPAANKTADVSIQFEGYKYVAVWNNGTRTLYKLNDGRYNAKLGKGEGFFAIPFNS